MGEPYKQMSTEDLLGSLRRVRRDQSRVTGISHPMMWERDTVWNDVLEQEAQALKAELATRPHVPRPAEKRRQRQEAARKARGQGKSRNR